jgi:hypothetical protein
MQAKAVRQKWTAAEQPIVAPLAAVVQDHLACGRLRADLEELTCELFGVAADALDAYAEAKQAARVVDFQDMLALAARLLEDASVAAALAGKLDLVVVDEFQDTSPMQLAVVSALSRVARRSVGVGDRKQAIFGFQGSDPVLMGAAMEEALAGRDPELLSESWRSRPPLVAFTSELFTRALGPWGFTEREVRISTPAARPDPAALAREPVLECWWWEGNGEPHAIADGVARRVAEAPPVREKETGAVRPLQRRDVAVLARRNDDCRAIAAALLARGIPARLELSGLAQTPEAILLRSALALVADPADGVAAMDVSYLGGRGAADPDAGSARPSRPRAIGRRASAPARRRAHARRCPPFATSRASPPCAASTSARGPRTGRGARRRDRGGGILELLRTWRPAQRLANLEALRGAASIYEDLCRVRRSAATVAGLVEHPRRSPTRRTPTARRCQAARMRSRSHLALGEGARVAGHVLACWLREGPRRLSVGVERPGTFDPARPLAGRWVRWWPWPYGALRSGLELDDRAESTREAEALREDEARERVRLLYVTFTRARDRLVLAGAVKKGAPVITALAPLCDDDGRPVLSLPFGAPEGSAMARTGDLELPCRVRALSGAEVQPGPVVPAPRPWYDGAPPVARPREIANPSSEPISTREPGRVSSVSVLAGRASLREGIDMGPLGDALHAFLAADRCIGDREAIAARLLAAHGVGGAIAPASLVRASDALRVFLDARYPGAVWRREWPVRARLTDRGQPRLLQGEVDLFLELPDGFVLVDHKSFPGNDRERDARVVAHAAQLGLYAFVLERALAKPLLAAFIHLPVRGEIVEVDVAAALGEWRARAVA